jgi:O-acetyl-ADP-ribose deacetylase (regulator of RNase III)
MLKQIPLISGNLLDFPTHCETDPDKYVGINNIAHSCNCQNVMGGGIAKQIKDRYPQAFEADTEFHNNEYNDGGAWKGAIGNYSKAVIETQLSDLDIIYSSDARTNLTHATIYNLYTQSGYSTKKREVNYEYFWRAMKAMQEDLLFNQHELNVRQVVGLPYGISCGLAGGNWKIIKAIIEDIFLDSMIECYIVKFEWAEYYNFIDER